MLIVCLKSDVLISRIIHEAFQFLIRKTKHLSGRSATDNWVLTGGRGKVMGLLGIKELKKEENIKEKS